MQEALAIIPAYNEEGAISSVIRDLETNAPEFDYIVINDCSTDGTARLLEQLKINHLNLPINLGIGGAVQLGYQYALKKKYSYAVQFDGDGQHDARYLPIILKTIRQKQIDMVIGSRFIEKEGFQSSQLRRLGIRYFSWLIRILTGSTVTDPTSGLRLVSRDLIGLFAEDYPRDYPEPESAVAALKAGYKVTEIPVKMKPRKSGHSSIRHGQSVYYMVKVTMATILRAILSK